MAPPWRMSGKLHWCDAWCSLKGSGNIEITYFDFSISTRTISSPAFVKYPQEVDATASVVQSKPNMGVEGPLDCFLQNGAEMNCEMIAAGMPLTSSELFCVDLWILEVSLWAKTTEVSGGELYCLRLPQIPVKSVWPQIGNRLFKNTASMFRYATAGAGIESSQGLWRFLDQQCQSQVTSILW